MTPDPNILPVYVVYERPRDYPAHFVVRRHEVGAGESKPTDWFQFAPTLDEVRRLIPRGLSRLPRMPVDDPCVVETWL